MGTCIRMDGIFSTSIRAGLLIALLVIMAIPAAAQEPAGTEPAEAPHWSPYSAPTDFTSEDQVYTIIRGDNLWNLAGQFYGDSLLWPQIWDANQYIKDAHWIYPGDPLVIPGAPNVAADRMVDGEDEYGPKPLPGEAVEQLDEEPVPPGEMVDPASADGGDRGAPEGIKVSEETPGAVVNPVDVYCAPMIVPDFDRYEHSVDGGEEMEKVARANGDIIYLDAGEDDGITAGDRFFAHREFRKVKHPEDGGNIGWAMRRIGEVEVLCANEHDATAVITYTCAAIENGDRLTPYEELAIPVVDPTAPQGRCDDLSGDKKGYLVYTLDDQSAVAEGDLAVIDVGSDDGVGPGDFFTIYRYQKGHRLTLGEALVILTERDTATVKLIASYREIYVGDRINVK